MNDEDKVQPDDFAEEVEPTDEIVEGEVLPEEGVAEDDPAVRMAALEAQVAEYLDGWQRARAELANYRKRIERERTQWGEMAAIEVVMVFLPAIDDMARALENIPPEATGEPWLDGIRLIYRKLLATLESLNVREIEAEGQRFDPAVHEAITHEESATHSEGEIIGVVQKGYMMNDKVVRPARVRVAK